MADDNGWLGTAEGIVANVGGKVLAGAVTGSAVPGLGTVLGGLTGLASAVVPYVFSSATQPALQAAAAAITGATDEAAQVSALKLDPEALAKYQDSARQIAEQEIEARLNDTQDARSLQEKLVEDHSRLAYWPACIDAAVLGMFAASLAWILKYGIPQDPLAHDIVVSSMGILATLTVQVVSYWRGSSSGSAAGRSTIQKLAMRNGQ